MSEKSKRIVRRCLLAFVLLTVGFALGKEYGQRKANRRLGATAVEPVSATADRDRKVLVYYAHATFRCVTCNKIESLTRQLLETRFGVELDSGRIEWREVDFQEDEDFARRYEIVSSCVVVARDRGEEDRDFQRLDKVWTLIDDPPGFEKYVAGAIRLYLDEADGGV